MPGGRFRRGVLLVVVALALLTGAAVLLRSGDRRADRLGSHLRPGQRFVWRLADGSATAYLVKAVSGEGAVTYDRLRFESADTSGAPTSQEERTYTAIPVSTFTTLQYAVLGSTVQSRPDQRRLGGVSFDCAVVRVWRPQREGEPTRSIYEEWIPVDGDQVVFPGCALHGEDPMGTVVLELISVD